MRRDILAGAVGILILIGAWMVAGSTFFERGGESVSTVELGDVTFEIPKDRVIVDFGTLADGSVGYSYLVSDVPDKLAPREILEMRNESSYTEFVEVVEPGNDPILKLSTVVYAQPAFVQDVDGTWKYLEYATTTQEAFRNRDATLWTGIRELFVKAAYADTLSPFSGSGDGYVGSSGFHQTFGGFSDPCDNSIAWSNARTAASGDTVNSTAAIEFVYSESAEAYDGDISSWTCTALIYRGFLPFDTSALSSAATISAVTLNVYAQTTSNGDNDGTDYITVSTSTQATHTTLAVADFDTAGPVTMNAASEAIDSGQRKDITSISTAAYTVFTLNSAGRNAIKKNGETSTCSATAGISCFSLREGHDAENNLPADNSVNSVDWYTSEQTGTSNDPYLEITYTAPASTIPGPAFSIGGSGLFEVGSDGLFEYAPF